ncbi:hypothetical protein B7486_02010 [cyanobacterium TDX16]|nr:hypothetical protein B7486_02010 [cyanobacterium TDX16]
MKQGFTLIELSIVLIVVSVISGGILVGHELVLVAELRSQARDIEQYNAAANAFRLKYGCLPGDCADAISIGFGTFSGNGNGRFDGGPAYLLGVVDGDESRNFWYHLSRAEMIEGSYPVGGVPAVNSPPLKMYNVNPRQSERRAGLWIASTVHPFDDGAARDSVWLLSAYPTLSAATGTILPADAYRLDAKIDDGLPVAGNVRVLPACTSIDCDNDWCACTVDMGQTCVVGGGYNIGNAAIVKSNMCTLKAYAAF